MEGVRLDSWWHIDGAPTPEEWTAVFTGGTLFVAAVAAIFALVQLRAFFVGQWDQARPYLVVDFVFQNSLMQVEVRNISSAAAANVELSVSPDFLSTVPQDPATLNLVFSPEWRTRAPGLALL